MAHAITDMQRVWDRRWARLGSRVSHVEDQGGLSESSDDRLRRPEHRSAAATAPALDRVRQMICSLHGHDLLLHFEHDRLSLRCATCAWESPGWTIEGRHESPSPDEDSS